MGRYRPFSNTVTTTCSDYKNNIAGIEMMKNARTYEQTKDDENFKIIAGEVTRYNSYNTYLRMTKGSFLTKNGCHSCSDVPVHILEANQSEICYDNLLETLTVDFDNSLNNLLYNEVYKTDACKREKGVLYPHGTFNNRNAGRMYQFPCKINVQDACMEKIQCAKYQLGKCPDFWDSSCCNYQEIFPTPFQFASITVNPATATCASGNLITGNDTTLKSAMMSFSVFPRNS